MDNAIFYGGPIVLVGGAMVVGSKLGLRSKETRRVFTLFHHILVACLGAWNTSLSCVTALQLELGFEVSDTIAALAFGGSWTGLPPTAVFVHHAISAALEGLILTQISSGSLSFSLVSPFLLIFIGSGALDLCWAKILVFERHSTKQWIATVLYTACFLYLRFFLFLKHSVLFLYEVTSPPMLVVVTRIAFVVFALYHLLLGVGIFFSYKHGGRLPEKK
jgi:hypothetical protein